MQHLRGAYGTQREPLPMHDLCERMLLASHSQSITYRLYLYQINRGRITQVALRILRNGADPMKNPFEYVGIGYDMGCYRQPL